MRRINRLLVGPPGIGKTESTMQAYGHVEVLLLSSSVEEDIYGLPYREGDLEKRTTPPFLVRLYKADAEGLSTCLFLDELDKARKEVADTLLSLIASRRTPYGLTLPERTEIIAAANPPEYGGGDGISIPMLNRFSVQEAIVNPIIWRDWAYSKFSNQKIRTLIDMFATGELPLLDSSGEGLGLKIASPRSITYALMVLDSHLSGYLNKADCAQDIKGLLPTYFVAKILNTILPEDNDLITKSDTVVRRAKATNKHTPYRPTKG